VSHGQTAIEAARKDIEVCLAGAARPHQQLATLSIPAILRPLTPRLRRPLRLVIPRPQRFYDDRCESSALRPSLSVYRDTPPTRGTERDTTTQQPQREAQSTQTLLTPAVLAPSDLLTSIATRSQTACDTTCPRSLAQAPNSDVAVPQRAGIAPARSERVPARRCGASSADGAGRPSSTPLWLVPPRSAARHEGPPRTRWKGRPVFAAVRPLSLCYRWDAPRCPLYAVLLANLRSCVSTLPKKDAPGAQFMASGRSGGNPIRGRVAA